MPIDKALLDRIARSDPTLEKLICKHKPDSSQPFLEKIDGEEEFNLLFPPFIDQDMETLSAALETNTSITSIDFSGNNIGDKGANALAKMLKKNTTIAEVFLPNNQISDTGMSALAEALETNTSVTLLFLAGNKIGDKGVSALAEMLKKNISIISIFLDGNEIGDMGESALAEALETNTSITELYFNYYNNLTTPIRQKILPLLNRNDALAKPYEEAIRAHNRVLHIIKYGTEPWGWGGGKVTDKNEIFAAFSAAQSQAEEALQKGYLPSRFLLARIQRDLKSYQEKLSSSVEEKIATPTPLSAPLPTQTVTAREAELEAKLLKYREDAEVRLQQFSVTQAEMSQTLSQVIRQNIQFQQTLTLNTQTQVLEAKAALLTELRQQTETLEARQDALTQQLNTTFEDLRASKQDLEKKIQVLRIQAKTDDSVRQQLQELEARLQPMIDEFNIHQRTLEQQQYLFRSPHLKAFYWHVQAKLNQFFLAYVGISSGLIDKSPNNKMIQLLGKGFDLATLGIASYITDGINAIVTKYQTKKITQVADTFLPKISAGERIAEFVARELALRYEDQIKEATLPNAETLFEKGTVHSGPRGGIQTLAECAVGRMLDTLVKKRNEVKAEDLEQVLVDSVFSASDKKGFLGFQNQKIDTEAKREHPLTDQGMFQRSGIKVRTLNAGIETTLYFSAFSKNQSKEEKKKLCSRPDKYGYHWGTTRDEADRLGLHDDNPSVPALAFSHSNPPTSITRVVKDVKNEHKAFETRQELNRSVLEKRMAWLENDHAKLKEEIAQLQKKQQEREEKLKEEWQENMKQEIAAQVKKQVQAAMLNMFPFNSSAAVEATSPSTSSLTSSTSTSLSFRGASHSSLMPPPPRRKSPAKEEPKIANGNLLQPYK